MKLFPLLLVVSGCLLVAPARVTANSLDDLIAGLRSGAVKAIDPVRRQAIFDETNKVANEKYQSGLVALYLCEVKRSIVDPEDDGGWPYRSFMLVDDVDLRHDLTEALTKRFTATPDAIGAYALICPAIYAGDEGLVARCVAYLQKNDRFLFQRAEANMDKYWRPWIQAALRRQTQKSAG